MQLVTAFMCETKPYKAKFLSEAFPSVPIVFEDMCELWKGKGRDWLTKKIVDVPKVSQPVYILCSVQISNLTFAFFLVQMCVFMILSPGP